MTVFGIGLWKRIKVEGEGEGKRERKKERGGEGFMCAVERGISEESREARNKQNDVGNLLATSGYGDV